MLANIVGADPRVRPCEEANNKWADTWVCPYDLKNLFPLKKGGFRGLSFLPHPGVGAYCIRPQRGLDSCLRRNDEEGQECLTNVVAQFIEPYGLINQATTFSDNFAGMTNRG